MENKSEAASKAQPQQDEDETGHAEPSSAASVASANSSAQQRNDEDEETEEEEDQCPICFIDASDQEDLEFVHGPCGHEFCLPCLSRHLMRKSSSNSTIISPAQQASRFTAPIDTPTLGRCPVCRDEIYLLDVQRSSKVLLLSSGGNDDALDPDGTDNRAVYQKNFDSLHWPIAGSVFAERLREGGVGFGSFHFPPHDTTEHPAGAEFEGVAYTDMSRIPSTMMNAQTRARIAFFQSHFHEPTRTFRGRIPVSTDTCYLDVLLQFSADYSFISDGVIIKRRQPQTSKTVIRKLNPFDGIWKVSIGDDAQEESQEISVTGNMFSHEGGTLFAVLHPRSPDNEEGNVPAAESPKTVRLLDASAMKVVWELHVSEWDKESCPLGPEVGETIRWKSPEQGGETERLFTWTRVAVSETVPPDAVNRLAGKSGRIFQRILSAQERVARQITAPSFHSESIWGNTFCQGFKVGLASYHFVAPANDETGQPAEVYISYEHPATGQWPLLDNGMPVPSRVRFQNVVFLNPHSFRGEVRWQEDYETAWQGMVRWEYEMTFDSNFCCVLTGNVKAATAHREEEPHEWSRYGENLVYLNAALFDDFRSDPSVENPEGSRGMRALTTLSREGASGQILQMINRVRYAAGQEDGDNPFDFNM